MVIPEVVMDALQIEIHIIAILREAGCYVEFNKGMSFDEILRRLRARGCAVGFWGATKAIGRLLRERRLSCREKRVVSNVPQVGATVAFGGVVLLGLLSVERFWLILGWVVLVLLVLLILPTMMRRRLLARRSYSLPSQPTGTGGHPMTIERRAA